ncbi:P-loop NTPase family protein [Paenibacillus glycinis]|uniref:Uncharacterized protein n=1 Tax=Paenibacillus glycinis TaxID=2697035 RepID=A0ABW9XV65_9BACL|nr:hypothetical protein [Paenibacillus glycinis]NBD26558.1 hypothetical protein [Paenibacillus glycinis]
MNPKLALIEGLPGFGKTTTALLVHEILTERNLRAPLFLEGNLDHPADYDGVALFKNDEWDALLAAHEQHRELLNHRRIAKAGDNLLPYRKLLHESGSIFSDEWLQAIVTKDIYELSLDRNRQLVTDRWRSFAENASGGTDVFVFECCFIQNPVTMGMIKHGARKEDVIGYVVELAAIAARLDPLLIYVEQRDLDRAFGKAVAERPKEWSEGFIDYYTNQKYGKTHGFKGLDGTLKVLRARKELEEEIYNDLRLTKVKVDNASFDRAAYKQVLADILSDYFKLAR